MPAPGPRKEFCRSIAQALTATEQIMASQGSSSLTGVRNRAGGTHGWTASSLMVASEVVGRQLVVLDACHDAGPEKSCKTL